MATPLQLGTVIAERSLNGGLVQVTIKVGMPYTPIAYPNEVWCPYQIDGIASGRIQRAIGSDGIQAILLAFQKIGVELYSSEEFKSNKIKWHRDTSSKLLGFPVMDNMADLLPNEY